MVLPQSQGASQIYVTYVEPFLREHEGEISNYAWIVHCKLKSLGAEYIARILFYVKEYAAHYIMNTEVHQWTQSNGSVRDGSRGALSTDRFSTGTSYLDTLFSGFKLPPTFVDYSTSSGGPPASGEPNVLGSMLKFGAAALQSKLQTSTSGGSDSFAGSTTAGGNFGSFDNNKSGYAQSSFNGSSSRSVSGSSFTDSFASTTATGIDNANLNVPKARSGAASSFTNPDGSVPKASSSNSLNSDNDFDFVKRDDSSSFTSEHDSLLGKPSDGSSMAPSQKRSSSWFNWKKSASGGNGNEQFPSNPVKLD